MEIAALRNQLDSVDLITVFVQLIDFSDEEFPFTSKTNPLKNIPENPNPSSLSQKQPYKHPSHFPNPI